MQFNQLINSLSWKKIILGTLISINIIWIVGEVYYYRYMSLKICSISRLHIDQDNKIYKKFTFNHGRFSCL